MKKWFLTEKLVGLFLALGMGFILSLIIFTSELIREFVGYGTRRSEDRASAQMTDQLH